MFEATNRGALEYYLPIYRLCSKSLIVKNRFLSNSKSLKICKAYATILMGKHVRRNEKTVNANKSLVAASIPNDKKANCRGR